jgi:hypothetical protein
MQKDPAFGWIFFVLHGSVESSAFNSGRVKQKIFAFRKDFCIVTPG